MFNIKDHNTGNIFDPWDHIGPKKRELLENSWAGVFRTFLFEKLPVQRLKPYFSTDMGRPSKELYVMLGALILQQMLDLSDKEVQGQIAFDDRWRYAPGVSISTQNTSDVSPAYSSLTTLL